VQLSFLPLCWVNPIVGVEGEFEIVDANGVTLGKVYEIIEDGSSPEAVTCPSHSFNKIELGAASS
jgi:hypothetical protein